MDNKTVIIITIPIVILILLVGYFGWQSMTSTPITTPTIPPTIPPTTTPTTPVNNIPITPVHNIPANSNIQVTPVNQTSTDSFHLSGWRSTAPNDALCSSFKGRTATLDDYNKIQGQVTEAQACEEGFLKNGNRVFLKASATGCTTKPLIQTNGKNYQTFCVSPKEMAAMANTQVRYPFYN